MTLLEPAQDAVPDLDPFDGGTDPLAGPGRVEPASAPEAEVRPPAPVRWLLLVWVLAILFGQGLVIYGLGPMFQERTQRHLLHDYRTRIEQAVNGGGIEAGGPVAPAAGATVGILEVGGLELQQAVVEGTGPEATRRGPGHVPGTAGLGQPGNAVVVGRRGGFGGPFGGLSGVAKRSKIVVTTTQGQSVYEVTGVRHVRLATPDADGDLPDGATPVSDVYGPTSDDRLTLVTSARNVPWNGSSAVVLTAALKTEPFEPTLQGTRDPGRTGGQADAGARAAAVLAVVVYGLAMGAAVVLYRRLPARIAYLLTGAPIVAMTIVSAETVSRLLPAWL